MQIWKIIRRQLDTSFSAYWDQEKKWFFMEWSFKIAFTEITMMLVKIVIPNTDFESSKIKTSVASFQTLMIIIDVDQ
jgi:hypothetical protein